MSTTWDLVAVGRSGRVGGQGNPGRPATPFLVVRHVLILDLKSPLRRALVTNTRNHQRRHPERSEGSRLPRPALLASCAESRCFAEPVLSEAEGLSMTAKAGYRTPAASCDFSSIALQK